jgi:P2 family phage contractile tail tube protein
MRNGIPAQNNVFKLYDVDTGAVLDGAVTVELPSFELMSNTYKGAGVGGEINVPAPGVMNALSSTISVPIIYGAICRYLELGSTRILDLRNEMVIIDKDSHSNIRVPNRWILKGPISQANPGKVEQAATSDASIVVQIYYARHWLDGEEVLEWDPFKGIYTVNKYDLLEILRRNVFVG